LITSLPVGLDDIGKEVIPMVAFLLISADSEEKALPTVVVAESREDAESKAAVHLDGIVDSEGHILVHDERYYLVETTLIS
jgi:hypothetical protein